VNGEGIALCAKEGDALSARGIYTRITAEGDGGPRLWIHVMGKSGNVGSGVIAKPRIAGEKLRGDTLFSALKGGEKDTTLIDNRIYHDSPLCEHKIT
jgi:hypothetical protein